MAMMMVMNSFSFSVGGSWFYDPRYACGAYTVVNTPDCLFNYLGFRLVRDK